MPNSKKKVSSSLPADYQRFEASDRRRGQHSNLIGPADPKETVTFTIMVRRRPDGPSMPDFDYWQRTPPGQRQFLSADEFANRHGGAPADFDAVKKFVKEHGMSVVEAHAARRTIIVKGTVAQINAAFAIELKRYDSPLPRTKWPRPSERPAAPGRQNHRSYEGSLHLPVNLTGIIVGVFGLDDRKVTSSHNVPMAFPWAGTTITAPEVCQLYGWPIGSIPKQTIGILSEGGLDPNDITLYYQNLNLSLYSTGIQEQDNTGFFVQGSVPVAEAKAQAVPAGAVTGHLAPPSVANKTLVVATTLNNLGAGYSDGETNMDVSLSSTVAQGATIALYFFGGTTQDWINVIGAAIHPATGKPQPSVLSCSFYIAGGDDPTGCADWGVTPSDLTNISSAFQDASVVGVTVCIASGDTGCDSKVNDGYTHVSYPGSDPWVLSCGGTVIGEVNGTKFDEWIWNDYYGATGGGVSALFPLPSYQNGKGIPSSLNPTNAFTPPVISAGRGVPDVSANASPFSGYPIYCNGQWEAVGGTSASAPLIAGLIAQLNAKLGHNIGFINPTLYSKNGSWCRKIAGQNSLTRFAGNSYNGVQGYPGTQTGWDACTGWGVFNWATASKTVKEKEIKEIIKEKEIKEKEKEVKEKEIIDKTHEASLPGGSHAQGSAGSPVEWTQKIEQPGHEVRGLHAFIRPEDRPPVGDQALAQSAAARAN